MTFRGLCHGIELYKITNGATSPVIIMWEYTGSNRGPSACKADALNQLSYTPNILFQCTSRTADPPAALAFKKSCVAGCSEPAELYSQYFISMYFSNRGPSRRTCF